MSRSLTGRIATQTLLQSLRCSVQTTRAFSQTSARREEKLPEQPQAASQTRPKTESLLENIYGASQASVYGASQASGKEPTRPNAMANLSQSMVFQALNKSKIDTSALSGRPTEPERRNDDELEPYHLHIYSHKHNTHVTCTKPNREPIISLSCGNLGFKKARRGTFDAGYSLTKYVFERLHHTGWPVKMNRLELVLRGFGQGREAALKVLMNPEGKALRDKVIRVADSTRVKFGGTRSPAQRRL